MAFTSWSIASASDTPGERAAAKLAREIEARRAVEIRVRTEVVGQSAPDPAAAGGSRGEFVDHYIETAAGERFFERRMTFADGTTSRTADYCDGARYAHVEYNRSEPEFQNVVFITRQFFQEDQSDRRNMPEPLLYLYVGRLPLHKALPNAEYLGESRVLDRPADKFLFRGVRWFQTQDHVYHLDRATGTPLKVEAFRDDGARSRGEPLATWVAETFDRVEGHPIALRSVSTVFHTPNVPTMTWKIQVELMKFDKTYPMSTFWPTIQDTAMTFDGLTGKAQNPKRKRTPKPAETPPKAAKAAKPPPLQEAVPPTDWTTHVPAFALVLGCGVLVAAGALWWRRR